MIDKSANLNVCSALVQMLDTARLDLPGSCSEPEAPPPIAREGEEGAKGGDDDGGRGEPEPKHEPRGKKGKKGKGGKSGASATPYSEGEETAPLLTAEQVQHVRDTVADAVKSTDNESLSVIATMVRDFVNELDGLPHPPSGAAPEAEAAE